MFANWVIQAVSAGGTGNLTLGAADTDRITLNTAIGLNKFFNYLIDDGTQFESGIGYLSASTTLVRSTVLETLVSGTLDRTTPSAINVTTAAKVYIAPDANLSIAGHRPGAFSGSGFAGMTSAEHVDETGVNKNLNSSFRYFWPWRWRSSQVVQTVGVSCSTAGTVSARLRVGIYEIESDGLPGRLITEFTAGTQIDCSTTGVKSQAAASPFFLPAGDYFMCAQVNETAGFYGPQFSASGIFMGLATSGLKIDSLYRSVAYGAFGDESASTLIEQTNEFVISFWLS